MLGIHPDFRKQSKIFAPKKFVFTYEKVDNRKIK